MTQPFDIPTNTGPVLPFNQGAAPGPAPLPPPVQGPDWGAIQRAESERAAAQEQSEGIQTEEDTAELEALRATHGAGETGATQFARGAMDALLSPGALVGAAAETVGELWQAKQLRDFGRDLGKASSGKSAAEALAFVFGGGGKAMAKDAAAMLGAGDAPTIEQQYAGTDAADRAVKIIDEQERARPLLTTISRIAGASALSIGVGAGASAHSGPAAMIAALGAEGAGTGAQAAYEQSAPLRDVLASAAIGGILGAGIGAVGEGVQRGIKKLPDLAKVFGDKVQDFADQRAWKAVVDRDPQAMKDWMRWSPERRARVVDRIRESGLLGKGDDAMLEVLERNADDASRKLGELAQGLDEAGIKPSVGDLRESLMKQTTELRASGSGTLNNLADAIEAETAPFMNRLAITQTDDFGKAVVTGYREPTFSELRTFKQALGAAKSKHMRAQSLQADELRDLYGNVARTLDNAADQAGPQVGKLWRESNEAATDFITLKDALQNQMARKLKNRFISPSDYGTSVAAGLASAVLSGNPFAGLATAAGTALLHKGVREGGSAIASKLANRFARFSTRISKSAAGGAEAQEILELMKRARMLVDDTVGRAGANPTVRQTAEETARAVAAREIEKRAGAFNPAEWHKRPVTPVQKLVFRSQILDQASDDLARAAKEVATLHPQIPDALDVRRIEKLTRDAAGPEALATLQKSVADITETVPRTMVGDASGVLLRKLGMELDRAGVAEAMASAHQVAGMLSNAAAKAGDEASKNFAERAAQGIRDALSSEHFGAAGREYRALTSRSPAILETIGDAKKIREALRVGDSHGHLASSLKTAQAEIGAAHDAAFKLAGVARPKDLGLSLQNADKLFARATEATLIDGKGMHKLFDVAGHAGVHEGIPHEAPPVTVAEAVEPGLEKLSGVIKHEVTAAAGKATPERYTPPYLRKGAAAAAGAMVGGKWPELLEEKREVYDKRLDQLAELTTRPDLEKNYGGALSMDVDSRLQKLLEDMPKPNPSLKGKAFETLSEGDLNKANAMWEATTAPLSLFDDLAGGSLDYDKVSYTWQQYPGLQQACQAGVMDVLTAELDDDERAGIPDAVLTQLDYAFGFQGKLQDTVEHGFATRMSGLFQPKPEPGAQGGTMQSPAAEPSFTQRIANG